MAEMSFLSGYIQDTYGLLFILYLEVCGDL